jgi:hypothetical protein
LFYDRVTAYRADVQPTKEANMVTKVVLAAAYLVIAASYVAHAWHEWKGAASISRDGSNDAKP